LAARAPIPAVAGRQGDVSVGWFADIRARFLRDLSDCSAATNIFTIHEGWAADINITEKVTLEPPPNGWNSRSPSTLYAAIAACPSDDTSHYPKRMANPFFGTGCFVGLSKMTVVAIKEARVAFNEALSDHPLLAKLNGAS
jgi:hypothetical protein